MNTRAIGYIRASTDEQTLTLEVQRTRLRAYAVAMDLELVAILEDPGRSGKTLDRAGLREALRRLENGEADALLVTKLDRLTRSVEDLGTLIRRYFGDRAPFGLLSVGDSIDTRTAGGRLVLNVLASVAQWEREATVERTRDALAQVKADGGRVGRIRIGERRSSAVDASGRRMVELDEGGAAALARARALRASGASLAAIAGTLTSEGHPTARGGAWAAETVRRALARQEGQAA